MCPWPGSFPGESPLIDWAVMQDPFGNQFCLVTVSADGGRGETVNRQKKNSQLVRRQGLEPRTR
jgi:hypothetical protein